MRFVAYDAGGHGEYQELHQAFFSAGALYLLLWDASKPPPTAELCRWATSIQACAPGAAVLPVGSHLDEAASPAAAARSGVVVVQHLQAALAAQAGRLAAELQQLDPSQTMHSQAGHRGKVYYSLKHESRHERADGAAPTPAERRVVQLVRLLQTPLRLSPEPVLVSAKTLENCNELSRRLVDMAFDAESFPEFGSPQPRSYDIIAARLRGIIRRVARRHHASPLPAHIASI